MQIYVQSLNMNLDMNVNMNVDEQQLYLFVPSPFSPGVADLAHLTKQILRQNQQRFQQQQQYSKRKEAHHEQQWQLQEEKRQDRREQMERKLFSRSGSNSSSSNYNGSSNNSNILFKQQIYDHIEVVLIELSILELVKESKRMCVISIEWLKSILRCIETCRKRDFQNIVSYWIIASFK
jgi:hypothetical protein